MDVPYGKNHDNLTYADNQTIKMIGIKVFSDRIFSSLKQFENICTSPGHWVNKIILLCHMYPQCLKSDRSLCDSHVISMR